MRHLNEELYLTWTTRARRMLKALALACSFLTALPVPGAEWTLPNLRFVPLALPVVGAVLGALSACLFGALTLWDVSLSLRAAVMTLFCLALTGGLHMDGFMDTCDAVFSRKERQERLRILSDPNAGAFAVMGCAAVLMLRFGIFSQLLETWRGRPVSFAYLLSLWSIPVYSRFGLGLLFYLPFAKENGLARTLGAARVSRDRFALWVGFVLCCVLSGLAAGLKQLLVPLTGAAAFVFHARYCVKTFGGVTGDLMGAYVELSEILMLAAFVLAGPGA